MNAATLNPDTLLTFNGINGATGTYLLPQIPTRQLVEIAKGAVQDRDHLFDLKILNRQASQRFRGVREGVDPKNLGTAGWGVIFADADREKVPGIRDALSDLLNLRRSQAGGRYKEFTGEDAYRPGETKAAFLARHGAGPGPVDPDRVPYYLLIVGDPETIPFAFQYQLDVQFAVGRLHFETLEDYANYARSLVAAETGNAGLPRRAVFFGVENDDDPATQLSTTQLVKPLAEKLVASQGQDPWEIQSIIGEKATKEVLADHLGGPQSPALIFTASHGMGFPLADPRQLPHQGALLCQNWPGPKTWRASIPQDFYFSADDVASDADLLGSVGFFFACYGAGTPQVDDFAHQAFRDPVAIAPHAFLARLPQRLLSHPRGGMLAAVGHVERAWSYSFLWEKAESQLAVFESTLQRLMGECPVGYAMEYFNERYAELSTELSSELQGARFGKEIDMVAMAGMWTANNDARSYVILGDPAVALKVKQASPMRAAAIELSAVISPAIPLADKTPGQAPGSPAETVGHGALVVESRASMKPDPLQYSELDQRWPDLSRPEDDSEKASFYGRLIASAARHPVVKVLELGCGEGNVGFHLKQKFTMTLVDPSEDLQAASRKLNPDCEHHQGDLRTVRLGREFDAVLSLDALSDLTSLEDLGQAIKTALTHCRPGGVALFAPDQIRERFRPGTDHGGHDGDQGAVRILKWIWDPEPSDSTYFIDFAYLLGDPSGRVSVAHKRRVCGLFSRRDWLDLLESAGFRAEAVLFQPGKAEAGPFEVFLGTKA